MIPLDNLERITAKMREPDATNVLIQDELTQWQQLPESERIAALKNIITHPVACPDAAHGLMFCWFVKTRWSEALKAVKLAAPVSMMELATGSGDMIPQVLAKHYSHPGTKYTSINLNKQLTADFKERTKHMPLNIEVIEDAAQNIEEHFGEDKVDVIIFEHSFNDIVEDIIGKKHGIDTVNTSWWDILQQMIDLTNEAYQNGTYEAIIKDNFLQMLRSLLRVLKPGSFIISYQFQYQWDLDRGILPQIWSELVSTVRRWIHEEDIGCEVSFDDFEPNWWLFIKKV